MPARCANCDRLVAAFLTEVPVQNKVIPVRNRAIVEHMQDASRGKGRSRKGGT